jgi:hypothetical protein
MHSLPERTSAAKFDWLQTTAETDKKVNVLTPENSVFTVFSGVSLFFDGV